MSDSGSIDRSALERVRKKEPTSCVDVFDWVFYCWTPVHQGKTVYRYGTVDPCTGPLQAMKKCFSLKIDRSRLGRNDDAVLAKELELQHEVRPPPDLEDHVFEFKESYKESVENGEWDDYPRRAYFPRPSKIESKREETTSDDFEKIARGLSSKEDAKTKDE